MSNIVDEILFVTDMENRRSRQMQTGIFAGTPVVASTIVQFSVLPSLST